MKPIFKSPGMSLFKTIGLVLTLGMMMSACSEATWKEEVLLHDGSKILATRSQSRGGRGEIGQPPIKEHSITFYIPGTSKPITWQSEFTKDVGHANLDLLALDILNGTPYIATNPTGCLAHNKWGRPNPPYIFFKYIDQEWKQISLQEFPVEIRQPNVVIDTYTEKWIKAEEQKSGFVSAASIKELNSSLTQQEYKKIVREPIKYEEPEGCPVMVRIEGGWVSPGGAKAPKLNDSATSNDKK